MPSDDPSTSATKTPSVRDLSVRTPGTSYGFDRTVVQGYIWSGGHWTVESNSHNSSPITKLDGHEASIRYETPTGTWPSVGTPGKLALALHPDANNAVSTNPTPMTSRAARGMGT